MKHTGNNRESVPRMKIVTGIVDRAKEHIKLLYGDINNVNPKEFVLVALVAPCPGVGFTVQYTLVTDDSDTRMMVKEVKKELEFFLIELGERNPWTYAKYHCSTASNLYSKVHWSHYTEDCVSDSKDDGDFTE